MDLQEFFKEKYAIYAGLALARITPPVIGYKLAQKVGERIGREKPRVYQQLRENLSHIPGTDEIPGQLDKLAEQSFINAGRYYYEFYHLVGKPIDSIQKKVHIPDDLFSKMREIQGDGRGVLIAGIHTGNFDLGLIAMAGRDLGITALSPAQVNGGYQVQNTIRKKYGVDVLPVSPTSLRKTIRKLEANGVVAVGVDWPQPEEPMKTEVFGKLAHIPTGIARLALLTNAVVFVVSFYSDANGFNQGKYSEPIELIRTGNKDEDIALNTKAYMKEFEKFVSQYPDQWLMYHKFWADEKTS